MFKSLKLRYLVFIAIIVMLVLALFSFNIKHRLQRISLNLRGSLLRLEDSFFVQLNSIVSFVKLQKYLVEENRDLKLKMSIYQNLERDNLLLINENETLKKILNYSKDSRNKFVLAKVLGGSRNSLHHFFILNVGKSDGVCIDSLVFSDDSIIGIVKNLTDNYSLMLLVTDPSIRIPVITEISKQEALVANIKGKMHLIYLDKSDDVVLNEKIFTSNISKLYSPNLLLGYVSEINKNNIIVSPKKDLVNTNFVLVEEANVVQIAQTNELLKMFKKAFN